MIEFSIAEWFRALPRRGEGAADIRARTKADPSASGQELTRGPNPAHGNHGDTVEISTEARRRQVETQVRNAVLAELRLLARFPASDHRAEPRADATP